MFEFEISVKEVHEVTDFSSFDIGLYKSVIY